MRRILAVLILLVLLAQSACNLAASTPSGVVPTSKAPTASPAPSATTAPAAPIYLDDFEGSTTTWQPGLPPGYIDSSAVSVKISDQHATLGKHSLELIFDKNNLPKAIFTLERPIQLDQANFLEFDLYNPGAAAQIAISLSTGDTWEWHESGVLPLAEGAQTISFDLQASNYKSAASNWELTTSVKNLALTQRIAVLIFPAQAGSVFIDGLRTVESASGTLPVSDAQLPTPTAQAAQAPTYLELKPIQIEATQYRTLDYEIATDGVFLNPFDPGEVNLNVRFRGPDGQEVLVPAFWFQDFDPATLQRAGSPGWRARFIPTLAGEWSASAEIAKTSLTSPAITFTAQANPKARGFIRIHPQNPRFFAFDDGSSYFPVGINMGWGNLEQYRAWLDGLSANGGNWIRVWMASWSFGLEWNDTGLGDYSARLMRAWQLDQIMKMAEERGVYVELVLINHGAFSATVNPEWANNPYNAANGGPCARPQDFATDPAARDYFKRRLRYIAARWSASPALMNWEWWNEADWTPINEAQMTTWIQEMTPVLRGYDPYDHLISNSYAKSSVPAVTNLPELDFAQFHLYSAVDPAISFEDYLTDWENEIPGKPIVFAEFGYGAGGEDAETGNRQGLHLHNGLWASTFSGYASTAMYWWWDSYVDPLDLWGEYGKLTRFLEGQDLAVLTHMHVGISSREVPMVALGTSDRALVWLHDRKYDANAMQRAHDLLALQGNKPGEDWIYLPDPIKDVTLTFDQLADGRYTAAWYSPVRGEWLAQAPLTVTGGKGSLAVPEFQGDLALKVLPAVP
jgi:hypothetical protein